MKKVKQLEEDEEYPLKIRQDSYTSNMEYGISDHKPVIGIFTLEVSYQSFGFIITPTVLSRYNPTYTIQLHQVCINPPLNIVPNKCTIYSCFSNFC